MCVVCVRVCVWEATHATQAGVCAWVWVSASECVRLDVSVFDAACVCVRVCVWSMVNVSIVRMYLLF